MNQPTLCGYVAIIGRPNVGKSTLLNKILDKKISITSDKPQTTRSQILGIKTVGSIQAIFIDTPGIHQTEKNTMNRYMNRLANSVILDADVIIFMVEASRWFEEDDWVFEKIKHSNAPIILAINKIDKLKERSLLLPLIEKLQTKFNFKKIIPISVTKSENMEALLDEVKTLLPHGPHLFPDEQMTDKTDKFQMAEMIREQLIRQTGQEVPYSTTVVIEDLKYEENLIRINAIIWVERQGQKAIIIGKEGERLKDIATKARLHIEKAFGKKVFLRVWVKVKDNWTNDEKALQNLGNM